MAGQTQLSARLGMDNGIFKHDIPSKSKRSSFPYGRKRDFCLDPGMIVPIDLWETLPGDYFELKLDYLIKSFPMKVPPFTVFKVRTHWYYCKKVDLWKGALTYMVKGRSHSISLSNPTLKVHSPYISNSDDSAQQFADAPMSLASFFGFQPGHYPKAAVGDYCRSHYSESEVDAISGVYDFYGGINLLPFFMYQKIYRLAYIKPNLLQNNKCWFPDDVSDGWRINYSKSNLYSASDAGSSYWSKGEDCFFNPTAVPSSIHNNDLTGVVPSVNDTSVNLLTLRYAMFEDDRFTTALPWPTRGTAPTIDVSSTASIDGTDISIVIDPGALSVGQEIKFLANDDYNDFYVTTNASGVPSFQTNTSNASGVLASQNIPSSSKTFKSSGNIPVNINTLGFNINDLRAKIALTVWQERNATTSGYYNEMVYAHFNENPDSQDYEPRYIGGTSDIVSFSEVIQHDNSSDDETPQGHSAGLGQVRSGGNVFSYRCKDYGYIMGVMIIQPETIYNSRIEKLWTRKIQEDEYFPEYQALGLQEILKGEIWPSGTSSDNNLFGYQERDTEYKTRDNMSIGFFACPHTTDRLMSAYSLCREFSSQPSLSQQFVTMSPANIRKDCLAVPSMPFFRCSLVTSVHAVRPMSYKTSPNTFGF